MWCALMWMCVGVFVCMRLGVKTVKVCMSLCVCVYVCMCVCVSGFVCMLVWKYLCALL